MNYSQIRFMDVANGEGIRVSLFASGCTHGCKGCFNREYWDFTYGNKMTLEVTNQIIEKISEKHYRGLTLLGGEPFQNLELTKFIKPIRKYIDDYNKNKSYKSSKPKDIWTFSGYTFEQLIEDGEKVKLLELCDVLIDGLFCEELLDLKLKYRGSSNQRILNVKKSLEASSAILYYKDEARGILNL